MSNLDDNRQGMENRTCLRCGSCAVDTGLREVEFEYGGREKPFRVRGTFPFTTCRECGFVAVDGDDETLRHEAACRHLGVMTPAEIQTLREQMGLSQKDLAELTGFGVASISRWERGLLIQNEACNQLLFLLTFPENLKRLRERRAAREGARPDDTAAAVCNPNMPVNRVFRVNEDDYPGIEPIRYVVSEFSKQ